MNIEEDNNWNGRMNTPTPKGELVLEMNSDILKTIHNLQVELVGISPGAFHVDVEHKLWSIGSLAILSLGL